MNILIVCHVGMYQDLSSSFIHAQAEAYAALGHRVRAIVTNPFGKTDRSGQRFFPAVTVQNVSGVEIVDMRTISLSNFGEKGLNLFFAKLTAWLHFSKILSDFRPNVIHAHTLGTDSALGVWLKKKLHCPLIVTTHGSDTSVRVEQGRAAELKPLCDGADHIVAVSSALAGKLKTCGTKTPITVILNGFRVQAHSTPSSEDRAPCSIVQVAHLIKQKHFDTTLHAFAQLKMKYPTACFTIIGQGGERGLLESLAEDLGVRGSVRFMGQMPNEVVMSEMAKAQFFCMPSVREGFGIVYLEAMASGCITIGTEGEGIADLIENGKNGFLVPPEDPKAIVRAISWCIEHPNDVAAIAEQGIQDARELTWKKNAETYIKLFTKQIERELIK